MPQGRSASGRTSNAPIRGDRPNQEHDAQECDPLKRPVRGQLSPFPLGKRFNWYKPGLTNACDPSLPLQSAFQLIHMRLGLGPSDLGDVPDGDRRRNSLSGSYQVFHLRPGLIWYDDSRSFPEIRNLHRSADPICPTDGCSGAYQIATIDQRIDLRLEYRRRCERFASNGIAQATRQRRGKRASRGLSTETFLIALQLLKLGLRLA
jgi:hypothetical protein